MGSGTRALLTTWIHHPTSALPEWIAHHRALGFDRIHLLYPRRDGEPAPALLAALLDAGAVDATPIACDASESGEQIRNAAIRAAEIEASETEGWGLFLGADEYLVLERHESVQALMEELGAPDAVTVPRRLFAHGAGGHEPGPVLRNATHIADWGGPRDWRSIVRRGVWNGRLPGYPTGRAARPAGDLRWLNGSGEPMPRPLSDHVWQADDAAWQSRVAWAAGVPAPTVRTMLLRAAYAHPAKSQPMPQDLTPILDAPVAEESDALARTANRRERALSALLTNGGIAAAQEAQCAEERRRAEKQSQRHKLWTAIEGYVKGVPLETAEARVVLTPDAGLTEAETRSPAVAKAAPRKEPPPEPVSAPAKRAAPVKLHPSVPDEFARVATDPPPPWFAEIYPGGERQGFLTRLEHHALVHIERDPGTLIVSFDNISNVYDISYGREPWAYKFVRDAGHSHLAVIARRKDWYRDPALIAELEGLAARGLFSRYDRVVMTGTSMGGFAALTFASLAPGCTVLAYSPQTTLDTELVPWEERFGMGRERNWGLPHSDAAFEIGDCERVFVVYDPFFEPDRMHIERLEGDNVTPLKAWFSGHFSAVFVRRAKLIKPLFAQVIDGTLTERRYYEMLRDRRGLMWYRKALEERALATGHAKLAARIGPAFKRTRGVHLQEA